MNKIITLFAVIAISLSAANGCKSIVSADALPEGAQTFLSVNFPGAKVSYVQKDCNEYEVILADGTEIEFNSKGEWKSVDAHRGSVPASVLATLPPTILSYLTTSFENIPVEKVEKGRCPAYKVELMNDLELEFDSKGNCKKIDD